jgi:hypothetical protein
MNDEADTLLIVYQRGFADGKKAAQRKPLTFAGLSITEIRLPDGMTARFENNTLIIEAAHNIKEQP